VIRQAVDGTARECVALRWGLVPSWADDPAVGNRLINARAETVASKPSFRAAFRQRRCLVPADGFYEWQKQAGKKQPFYIHLRGGGPFAFAGLWERWQGADEPIESFTIVTTEANELVRSLHERMPVILPREAYKHWLDPAYAKLEELQALLRPYPAEEMAAFPVSTRVNSPRVDDAACIVPVTGTSG
jgi:putative SOS response-associated peptidase YedK